MPGVADDGMTHPSGGMFTHTGSAFDQSDAGFPGDTSFLFTGFQGSTMIESQDLCSASPGCFTPVCTVQALSNDAAVANINFLGGPGDNDGPCNNCWGPGKVADLVSITGPVSGVPEPASFALCGLALLATVATRRISYMRSKR